MCWPLSRSTPSMLTRRARPPKLREASKTVTGTPRSASVTAAARPDQPAPMIATRFNPAPSPQPSPQGGEGKSSSGDPGAPRDPELADRGERGALGLELHQPGEVLGVAPVQDVRGGDLELPELVHREIDAALARVFAHVADDVGELEREAEPLGVVERPWIAVAEDRRRERADHARHAMAVELQRREIQIAALIQVHLHAVHDLV